MLRSFLIFFKTPKKRKFSFKIKRITGFLPGNVSLYHLALSHSSAAESNHKGQKESYERLEFLGDSILGAVVAEYLFKKYPFEDEGFLTDIRSRIVNRESLNKVGRKMGLNELVYFTGKVNVSHKSLYGDALEAIVGAVYLDLGFDIAKKFILQKILDFHFDIDDVISQTRNFKSLLIEYCQKETKKLSFTIIDEQGSTHQKVFTCQIQIDDQILGDGKGTSKKRSEQSAAEFVCKKLMLIE